MSGVLAALGALAPLITGLISSGVSVYSGLQNRNEQRNINAKNEELLRESWVRDDNAFSRAYNDITSKGFSPLAALGQSFGNTNPMSLQAPTLSMDTSSLTAGAQGAYSNYIARKQQETADRIADSQIKNVDADTRDKNASADVNEATTAVQILKAKAELDAMIANNNVTEAQIVKYLNDMKAEGISDNVIDSLLSQFGSTPNTPTVSAGDLSGNKTIQGQQALTTSQTNLADANKLLANAQKSLADANTTSVSNQNTYWTETKKGVQKSIDLAEQAAANYRKKVTDDRSLNTSILITTPTGTKRWMTLDNALDYIDVGIKDAQRKLAESNLGSSELKDYLSVIKTLFDGLNSIGNLLGGI